MTDQERVLDDTAAHDALWYASENVAAAAAALREKNDLVMSLDRINRAIEYLTDAGGEVAELLLRRVAAADADLSEPGGNTLDAV